VAIFVGKDDDIGDISDSRWVRDQINDNGYGSDILAHYKEYDGGHATFLVGMDMRYLEDLVEVLGKYNPIPDEIESIEEDFNKFDLDPVLEKYLGETIY
jgi:hypothetical protein